MMEQQGQPVQQDHEVSKDLRVSRVFVVAQVLRETLVRKATGDFKVMKVSPVLKVL
jgi:hypothetical protein